MEQITKEIYLPEIESKYDFNDGFKCCCKTLKKRVRQDYDAVLAVTGEEGVSKSTCANQIGFHTDNDYTLEKNILYSPNKENIKDAIMNLPRFSAVNGDEAIKILYKLQWWSPLQIFLNTFYRLCREENKISIFPMPRFSDFNEGFRNHRIVLWIHLLDRGIGVVFQKDWSPFAKDPWWFNENQKLIDRYRKQKKMWEFSLEEKIKILNKSRSPLDVITFPDLPPELRVKYKELKQKYTYVGLEEEYSYSERIKKLNEKHERRMKEVLTLLQEETKMTQMEIARRCPSIDQPRVSRLMTKPTEF